MILTTTNSIDGFTIAEYKGIVSGTAVNIQKMKMTFNMQKILCWNITRNWDC